MAKVTLDDSALKEELIPVVQEEKQQEEKPVRGRKKQATVENSEETPEFISCLRNERVIIRHVPKQSSSITNPKHILYGGMAESSLRTFVVPKLTSGRYVNVLTDTEKSFLENIMGLEPNALSIYKKYDNFWDDANPQGLAKVVLHKSDNYLDLSNPEEYIKYKILLANKDFIAPSLKELEDHPKATYQFVIISDGEEVKEAKKGMTITMQCYTVFGKIEDNKEVLRLIVEMMTGNPVSVNTKIEFLQTKINDLIQSNPKMFLSLATDPMLNTKVLIRQCVEAGLISHRGDQYYIREDNTPMCDNGDPTLNVAAVWLNKPKNQTIKLSLEAKLNN